VEAVVAVCAPTGIAAFNVLGVTLHRFFKLPVQHNGVAKFQQLDAETLKLKRHQLKDIKLLIIDKISMVSNVTFAMIEQRLQELFPQKKSTMGDWNVLLFGDLLQV